MMILFVYLPVVALYAWAMFYAYSTDNMFALTGWSCALITVSILLIRSTTSTAEERRA